MGQQTSKGSPSQAQLQLQRLAEQRREAARARLRRGGGRYIIYILIWNCLFLTLFDANEDCDLWLIFLGDLWN